MMKKPTLAEFAQLAEVVAALAVVVSLVYVGRELKSNTAAMRAESLQGVADASAQILLTVTSDSALSRIRRLGNRDISLLTEAEAFRYGTLLRQSLFTLQNVYFQNQLQVLDSRVWAGYRRVICDLWSHPGVRATWDLHRRALDPGFAELVVNCSSG
jgi:hypothetical protein